MREIAQALDFRQRQVKKGQMIPCRQGIDIRQVSDGRQPQHAYIRVGQYVKRSVQCTTVYGQILHQRQIHDKIKLVDRAVQDQRIQPNAVRYRR